MKNFNNNIVRTKDIKLLASLALLLSCSSILNASELVLANVSDNSQSDDSSYLEKESTNFSSNVFNDVNQNGVRDKDENGIAGVTVKLFDADGNEINVGPDGVLGTKDDSPGGVITNENGRYSFYKITHSLYRIQVEAE